MRRTTIMLPQGLKLQAAEHARNLGLSLGEFIRKSLEVALWIKVRSGKKDPLFDSEIVFKGVTPRGLSKNHDEYLYGE